MARCRRLYSCWHSLAELVHGRYGMQRYHNGSWICIEMLDSARNRMVPKGGLVEVVVVVASELTLEEMVVVAAAAVVAYKLKLEVMRPGHHNSSRTPLIPRRYMIGMLRPYRKNKDKQSLWWDCHRCLAPL
jgi:hypothetical protein